MLLLDPIHAVLALPDVGGVAEQADRPETEPPAGGEIDCAHASAANEKIIKKMCRISTSIILRSGQHWAYGAKPICFMRSMMAPWSWAGSAW